MKNTLFAILLVWFVHLSAQDDSQSKSVENAIEAFFEAFHQQDSHKMRLSLGNNPILQTIAKDQEGKPLVRTETFDILLKSIVSIPDTVKFEEKIKSFDIRIDGAMANAWTPYEFWLNGAFSHCGVNSFQLFNDGKGWKIIYLIDTRRKEDCD
jgi:hypothetical protein